MYESGLRTIRTSRDVNGRLFLYLKSSVCKVPRILTLPTYTQLNRHQVNDVGTFAGICRFDKVLYPQFGCEDS